MLKLVAALLTFVTLAQAHALSISDFNGNWKEVGWRCEGETAFQPRPFSGDKFFFINNTVFSHRVVMTGQKCAEVHSAGRLAAEEKGDHLEITPEVKSHSDCDLGAGSVLMDDIALDPSMMKVRLDDVDGGTYMVIFGNDTFYNPDCSNPAVERIYARK